MEQLGNALEDLMLEGVDIVDWAALRHAYGEASDVPELLRSLLSSDAGRRHHAIYELFGNIYHQGTVYPATAAAVPFLYELLPSPKVTITRYLSDEPQPGL